MAEETKKSLQQEREELEMEVLRDDVEQKRSRKQMRKNARKDNERAFKDALAKNASAQAYCNHKKGGRDYATVQKRGDGDNFAIMAFMHPLGYMLVLCSHCYFLWEPGVSTKTMADGKTPNPTKISYDEALRLPTDNTPCGSVIFGHRAALPTQAA